jgi:O-antigen ligase
MSEVAGGERREPGRTALRGALILLILVSPLPFGAVQRDAVLALELYAAACGAGAFLVWRRDRAGVGPRARGLGLLALGLVAIGALQLVPLPVGWPRFSGSPAAAVRERLQVVVPEAVPALAAGSLAPAGTVDALLRLLACVLVGFAAVVSVRRPAHVRRIAWAAVASGVFQALYGSAEYLSGHQHIFGFAKRHYLDSATGTFVNRNHFAIYLAMTLPLALGLAVDAIRRAEGARAGSWRARAVRLAEPPGSLVLAAGVAAALIWLGVLLSYSRGGLVAALVASVWLAFNVRQGRRAAALALVAVLAIPVLLLLGRALPAPGDRFVSESEELASVGGRMPVWQASLRMVPDHLPLGAGFGGWADAFPLYRPADVRKHWDHAHNEWLELLVEGGPLALLIVVAMLGLVVRPAASILGASAAAALLALAVAGLADFATRIPAVALLAAALAGLAVARLETRRLPGRVARAS